MKSDFLQPEFICGHNVNCDDAREFVMGKRSDYLRVNELYHTDRSAFDRMTYLMFHVVWRVPPISELQTKLWTC
jgi:hypothetical protein